MVLYWSLLKIWANYEGSAVLNFRQKNAKIPLQAARVLTGKGHIIDPLILLRVSNVPCNPLWMTTSQIMHF